HFILEHIPGAASLGPLSPDHGFATIAPHRGPIPMSKPQQLIMNGRLIPYGDARVHVLSTAMKYAASVYEAMRAYASDHEQQLYVFRLREHLQRLQRSAKIARIPLPVAIEKLQDEVLEVIRANDLRE